MRATARALARLEVVLEDCAEVQLRGISRLRLGVELLSTLVAAEGDGATPLTDAAAEELEQESGALGPHPSAPACRSSLAQCSSVAFGRGGDSEAPRQATPSQKQACHRPTPPPPPPPRHPAT